jgi:hypothetical protein
MGVYRKLLFDARTALRKIRHVCLRVSRKQRAETNWSLPFIPLLAEPSGTIELKTI